MNTFLVLAAVIPGLWGNVQKESVLNWETQRRPEILEIFRSDVYGRNAVERPADIVFTTNEISFAQGQGHIRVTLFRPQSDKPLPVFIFGDHRRQGEYPNIPTNRILERGYALVVFNFNDVDPDEFDNFTNGVHGLFDAKQCCRAGDAWGTIGAWAWGFSRVMDWIERTPGLDAKRVAIVGHSRGGKTTLWAGAQDERFAMTVSNNSGTGGSRLLNMDLPKSEPIERINRVFPHWFCTNFRKYGTLRPIPFDSHQLMACVAPRLLYITSASEDLWAGPEGEFEAARRASEIWKLYERPGLSISEFPKVNTPAIDGCVGYHLREGKHELAPYDWERFMDFADKHMK